MKSLVVVQYNCINTIATMENINCKNSTVNKDSEADEIKELSNSEILGTPSLPSLACTSPLEASFTAEQAEVIPVVIKDNLECSSNGGNNEDKLLSKRKRNTLTLQTKLEIIEKIKKGEKLNKLALEYGLGRATVSDIKRQEDKITSFISKGTCGTKTGIRKSMRKPNDIHLEKALNLWLSKERTKGNVISGPQLMQKAKSFYKDLYGYGDDSFKASSGWLQRFKLRNDIKHARIKDKNGRKKNHAPDENEIIQYQIHVLRNFLQERGYNPEQIYTVSIDQLHWKTLPVKLNLKKYSKSCVNVVTCVNLVGNHKIRPSVVVATESINSVVGAQENSDKLPFLFYYQQNGWMDGELFETWFQNEFVAQAKLYHPQAVILMDGTFSNFDREQFTTEDGKFSCVILHPSLSLLLQPTASYLFENMRWKYRCKLIERTLTYSSKKCSVKRMAQLIRHVTLRDVGYILSDVFDSISGEIIKNCYSVTLYFLLVLVEQYIDVADLIKKISENNFLGDDERLENIQNIQTLLRNSDCDLSNEDVIDWISIDGLNKSAMSDKDIIDTVRNDLTDSDSEEESSAIKKSVSVPSNKEALLCFSKCLTWLENQDASETSHLLLLWKLQNFAANKYFNASYK